MKTHSLPLIAALLVAAGPSLANGLPIQGDTAFTTGLSGAGVRTFGKVTATPGPDGTALKLAVPLVVLNELIDNTLLIGASVPFVLAGQTGGPPAAPRYGLGGLNVFGKINLFQQDGPGETLRVAGKLGLGLPTDVTAFWGAGDALQPKIGGPSAPTVSTSIIVTKLIGRFGVNSDVGLTVRPDARGVDPGDAFRYNGSLAYRVWPFVFKTYPDHQVNVLLEGNGVFNAKSRIQGELSPDSFSHTFFVAPGIQYMYGQFLAEASVQLAAPYLTTGQELLDVPTTTVLLGIRWLVF